MLPLEFDGSLTYDELVRTLDALEGTDVALVTAEPGSHPPTLELAGPLQRRRTALPATACFSIGSNPGLRLAEAEFESERLRTFEGAEFFGIELHLAGPDLWLGHPDLVGDRSERPDTA